MALTEAQRDYFNTPEHSDEQRRMAWRLLGEPETLSLQEYEKRHGFNPLEDLYGLADEHAPALVTWPCGSYVYDWGDRSDLGLPRYVAHIHNMEHEGHDLDEVICWIADFAASETGDEMDWPKDPTTDEIAALDRGEVLRRPITTSDEARFWIRDAALVGLLWHLDDDPAECDFPEEEVDTLRARQRECSERLSDPHRWCVVYDS